MIPQRDRMSIKKGPQIKNIKSMKSKKKDKKTKERSPEYSTLVKSQSMSSQKQPYELYNMLLTAYHDCELNNSNKPLHIEHERKLVDSKFE